MIVEKTDTGFSAYSSDHLIFTTGKSVSELISNACEAAELYFEEEAVKLSPKYRKAGIMPKASLWGEIMPRASLWEEISPQSMDYRLWTKNFQLFYS